MSNFDLLIIKPGSPKKMYGDLSSKLSGIEPPIFSIALASFVRDKGFSVKVIDAEVEEMNFDNINPLLVNIVVAGSNPSASSTPLMVVTREIINEVRSKISNTKIILTGIHPSALPERTLMEEGVDFVVQGESFYTIHNLLEALKRKKEFSEIKGLCYLIDGKMISNRWAEIVKNLDELPLPAWDLLDMSKYRAHNWHCFGHLDKRTPYAVIYTSLGCPYNCSYCNIHAFYNGKPGIRFRSPENIIKEIDFLVEKYNVKNIKFLDELFAVNEERVNKLCDLIIGKRYNLNIWAYGRINTVNEKMLEKMKRAGINWISYGIESGSEDIRRGVDKQGFEQDEIEKVVKMTQDKGIYVLGNFIFGLPDDSLKTMRETLNMAKELKCEYVNFYTAMAYPGSILYEQALKDGIKLPNNWLGFAQLSQESLPLPTKNLSSKEVINFRDNAFNEYFSNPEYLKMIKEKFGSDEVGHINEMLKHKINRYDYQ